MIKTWVMIMVISYYGAGVTTVTSEFNSLEACHKAINSVAAQVNKQPIDVKASGCFPKE